MWWESFYHKNFQLNCSNLKGKGEVFKQNYFWQNGRHYVSIVRWKSTRQNFSIELISLFSLTERNAEYKHARNSKSTILGCSENFKAPVFIWTFNFPSPKSNAITLMRLGLRWLKADRNSALACVLSWLTLNYTLWNGADNRVTSNAVWCKNNP